MGQNVENDPGTRPLRHWNAMIRCAAVLLFSFITTLLSPLRHSATALPIPVAEPVTTAVLARILWLATSTR